MMKRISSIGRLIYFPLGICLLALAFTACRSGNAASTVMIQTAVNTVAAQPGTPGVTPTPTPTPAATIVASPAQVPASPVPATHTDATCNPSPASPYQGQPGGFTEVQGTATKGEFWALVFGSVPFQAGEGAKVVWALDTGGDAASLTILAHDSAGNQIGPTSGPDSHLGSGFGRPGSEVGSTLVFPHDGCWEIDATAGSNQASMWFAVDPAPVVVSTDATPEPGAPALYPVPTGCTASPLPEPSADASGITASWLTGDGIALGSIRRTFFEGNNTLWWELDERAPLTLNGEQKTDPGTTLTVATDLSQALSTIYPTAVTFPAPGCWQLHAEAGTQRFDTTVYVYPNSCRPPSAFTGAAGSGTCEPPRP